MYYGDAVPKDINAAVATTKAKRTIKTRSRYCVGTASPGQPLQVIKNLRTCDDCHGLMVLSKF
ncbi:hypothetical protein TSUD_238660 [Trifolium subterraneum]|uniref:DYW domain-containing protein n=1 Tax=Trifolium subterraneum TaxID=3900 RepID=A0A2Z6PP32_TRISU|nr:hypothetical protein TSUD_238660 [Trifolium subterraneum]